MTRNKTKATGKAKVSGYSQNPKLASIIETIETLIYRFYYLNPQRFGKKPKRLLTFLLQKEGEFKW